MRTQKWRRISAPIAVALLAIPMAAQAQEQDQEAEEATVIEEVIITGSRIRQSPLETRTPVQFINEADIDATGTLSVGD